MYAAWVCQIWCHPRGRTDATGTFPDTFLGRVNRNQPTRLRTITGRSRTGTPPESPDESPRESLRPEQRKQNGLANTGTGEQHHQPVDAHSHSARGRHPELQRAQEVLVEV